MSISTHHRATGPHLFSEVIATVGLVLVIFALARSGRAPTRPAAVGAYITAAYFFTSSTSFANPAITVGRMFSNTFAGIAPSSVAGASSSPRWWVGWWPSDWWSSSLGPDPGRGRRRRLPPRRP